MIYIDLLFLLNWWIDFLLLLFVKFVLKRNSKLYRIILGSLFGSITTFFVFLNIHYILLTIIKLLIALIMIIISFGYKNIISNYLYLFMVSIILAGFLLLIKDINNKIYIIGIISLTPLLIFLFYYQNKKLKNQYSLYHTVKIAISSFNLTVTGFLDTGNKLIDPITKKPIILVSKSKLKGLNKIRSPMYVPVKTISGSDIIECYKPDNILIDNNLIKNYLIGKCKTNIKMEGIDCLLNNQLINKI